MSENVDWIALSGKRAKGRRPEYHDFATDRLLSIVMALVGEVSVLRERCRNADVVVARVASILLKPNDRDVRKAFLNCCDRAIG